MFDLLKYNLNMKCSNCRKEISKVSEDKNYDFKISDKKEYERIKYQSINV